MNEQSYICCPGYVALLLNVGVRTQFVVVVKPADKRMVIVDSLHPKTSDVPEIVTLLRTWFEEELDRQRATLRAADYKCLKAGPWEIVVNPPDIPSPRQRNAIDCGVFCAQCIKRLAARSNVLLGYNKQGPDKGIAHVRKMMALELACGRLMANYKWI